MTGNIVDLVQKKFYDNMDIQRAEELIVQTGSTAGEKEDGGYVDPKTGKVRTIPLEIFYKNDQEPVYGISSDDDNRAKETKALPFQAYGSIGMARDVDPDSASSQFFFLKWLQALVAPGRNTLDGYYACPGYVIQNEDILKQLKKSDKIVYAKVLEGIENFVPSGGNGGQTGGLSVSALSGSSSGSSSTLITAKSISKSDFLAATNGGGVFT